MNKIAVFKRHLSEVFASTYSVVVERYGHILHIVDYATTFLFTIEVTLRIWCADMLDDKYKGLRGWLSYSLVSPYIVPM